ncbi:hypothetical protein C7449_103141 [Mycoplana dimorpha]|uniref:Uncharacterized protein n=1 Tax=Mycoplana dimorpha TaxID=28320 RepID=A0A2T5BAX6_MYCDI|nr:hypothetical protein C7449_103141 [Mycoplana dimorpha]
MGPSLVKVRTLSDIKRLPGHSHHIQTRRLDFGAYVKTAEWALAVSVQRICLSSRETGLRKKLDRSAVRISFNLDRTDVAEF